MAKKPLQTLYESLRANNYDVPDNYGSFERTLTAPGTEGVRNRQTLYKALRDNNYDVPDTYESFSRTLFSPVKPTGGTAASGLSQLPADVEERRMRTRKTSETHPLNKSRARQRLQAQQQAIENQQQRWEQDNKRFKEDIARREQRLPGGMDRFEERAKEQLATGEAAPVPLAPNDEVVRGDIVFNPSTGRMEQTYTTPEGGTFFDRDAAQFDHSLQNMPDDEIEMLERERELIGMGILRRGRELEDEYENQSWWDRFLAGLATDPEMGPGPRERMAEEDEELQSLLTSWRKNRDALRILYDERDNNMNSFWHNFGTTVANGYTFTGGRAELHDAQAILNSSKRMDEVQRKMQAGEKLSNVENAALSLAQNTAWDNAIQAMYGDDYGAWATAGGAAVQSLEMMPEFIAGMPVLKGMGSAAIKLLTRNAANGLGRFMLKGLGMTLGTMAGGAIMANTIQAERTLGKAANKAAGSWWFGDDGEFMLGHYDGDNFVSGGESLAAALFHAEQEAIPEAASEGAGEFLPGIGQVLSKIGLSRIAKPLATLSGKGWYKTYQNMLRAAGWHGVGGEALEEYVGTLDGLIMGDVEGVKRLADPRTHFDIWLSCATLGPLLNAPVIVGSSMRGVYSPVAYHKLKAAVTRQDKIASFRLTEDRWAPWRDRIDATPNEQMADLMVEVRDNQELAPQEKKAIFDYVKALQGYRGWNLGEYIFGKDAEEEGDGKSEQEQQQSQEYSNGYDTVTPEERRAAKDRLNVARARLGEHRFVAETLDGMSIEEVTDLLDLDTIEDEDRSVLQEYINARTAYDGMLARVNDDIDDEVAVANEAIEQRVAPENAGGDGMIHPAVLKDGREVFIISGNVATLADNSIDVENSDGMIIVRDAEGNEDTISPDKIQSLGEVQDPAQQRQEVEQQIVDEQGQAAAAQIEGQLPFNVGDQYTINYQGEPHTYQVVQADENNVAVLVDGAQEPVVLTKQQLQQMADEEHAEQIQAQEAAADAVEEEPAAVEPPQSDDTEDQAAPVTEETPAAPVAPEDSPTATMPMDDQGEPAWDQVEPERGHQFLYQESGWPQAMADNFVQKRIDVAEKALKKAQEAGQKLIDNPKPTFSAQQQAVAENTAAQQAAQSALDYWKGVQGIQTQATAPVVEETAPVVETPAEQEPTEQAAPVAETEAPAEPEAVEPVEEAPAVETPAPVAENEMQPVEEAPVTETAQSAATEDQAKAPAEGGVDNATNETEPEAEPEKTDIELLQEEFADELSRDDIKVEVLPETFEESSAEMTVNVTVDDQATNIWFAVGEGNTIDEHWKRIYVPFYEMSWQEVDDLAEEYNQAIGRTVCDANDEAKRINFKDIEEAIAFEKWMQEREQRGPLQELENLFDDVYLAASLYDRNVEIIPESVEVTEDGDIQGRLRIDGEDTDIWVAKSDKGIFEDAEGARVFVKVDPSRDVNIEELAADYNKEFHKYNPDDPAPCKVAEEGDRIDFDDLEDAYQFYIEQPEHTQRVEALKAEAEARAKARNAEDIKYSIESQGEVPTGEKQKKFDIAEANNSGDPNEYVIYQGVYHDPSGYAVSTNGYILVADKRAYDEKNKGKLIASKRVKKAREVKNNPAVTEPVEKGQPIPIERYPNWKSVKAGKEGTETAKVDFKKFADWVAGVEARMKEQWQQWKDEHPDEKMSFNSWRDHSRIQIMTPDGRVRWFKFNDMQVFARAAADQGSKTLRYYPNQSDRALQAESKNGFALMMPMHIGSDYERLVDNPYRIEGGLNIDKNGSVFTYDMTMPGKTATGRVELNYESGKDAESRAYIEEVMEREGWDEEAKSEFRKILDDAADLVSRMAQGFTRLREWNNKKLTDEQGNYNPLWRVWDKAVGWIPNRSSFKKNGEYPYNIDLGALCTKREAFDAVVRYIKEQGWGQNLGPNQIEALKSLLREHGFLTACDICFNETKRARALDYGNAVAYYWNAVRQAVGIDDDLPVGTPRELTEEQMKILTALAASKNGKAFSKYIPKEVRRTYETYVNSNGQRKRREADKGLTPTMTAKIAKLFLQDPSLMGRFEGTTLLSTDSVDALVRQYPHTTIAEFIAGAWGSATPKPNEGFNIYDPLSWKQAYDKKRQRPAMDWFFNLGGFRAQSFSDYSPIFFYDYVQMFTDLAIRRLPIHIYTKVPALIKLFGGTGAKFNMSLVPEVVQGVDAEHLGLKPDGNGGWELAWHEDSFPVDEAFALRQDPRFNGNVGTIAVGISDAHIRMLLDDPRIDMVIPYHKSGMPKSVQIKTGLNNATDYTDDQKTKGKKKGLKDFSFNEALRRLGDPRKAADEYLAWCKQNKCTPKFPQFADHPNYYKVLEDFRCIDNEGNYSEQQPVRMSFFDDVEQRLSESLGDRTMQEGLDTAIRGNDAITEGIKKIMSKPRLDGKIRDMMLARLKQVLGKDNVASLKQEDFFEELQKVYTDQMGADRAQQKVEVLRTSGGIVYGFAAGDRIVLNENYFNAETPMHEFTHVWVKVARLANPQMWAEGKELLKQTKEWQEVMSDEFYRDIQGDEDAVASEVLARIVGQDAARQINEMFAPEDKPQERPGIYNKIRQWVNQFLDSVRSLFSENAKGLTYDELVRMPMKALFDDAEAARFMEALKQVNEEDASPEYQAKSLGAPYQGSNGQIATRIVDALPSGKRFVDLFSGGGAVTHAAMLSGKYEGYRMNDINPAGQELFLAGMRGDYRDYQPRELTAEEFKAIKGTPEGLLLSYSGYGRNVDSDKESVARRLRRVQRLEELKPYADQVESSNTDYREVQLQPGDVVYADIPYEGTNKTGYREGAKFDKQAFSDWALGQDVPIYVSEQSMPEGWVEVQSWDMKAMRGKTRGEKLFAQAKFAGDGGNATANGTDQTKSANFKNWFGDWENDPENASKVVDAEGRPLVVYHQTNAKRWINRETGEDWEKLDWRKKMEWENKSQEEWEDAWEEQDFYTFDDRYARQSIEMPAIFFSPENDPHHEYGNRTIAVYLNMRNPAINPDIPNRGVTDTAGRDAMEALKAQGYDGFIRTDEDGNIREYGVFDSNQVKSADENNGDFDPNNPDIRFRDDDEVAERDREYREAVERGDMKRAQEMLMEEADRKLNETLQLPDDSGEMGFKYHRGPAPKKIRTMYAVLNVSPDGMRAAYAGNKTTTPIGVWLDAVPLKSYASDKNKNDDGSPSRYVPGDTGHNWKLIFSEETYAQMMKDNPEITKSTNWLYERGGKHGTDVPNFGQMNVKDPANAGTPQEGARTSLPHNKLVFEIECGMDEDGDLTEYVKKNGRFVKGKSQGLSWVGTNKFYFFKTNPNASGNWGIAGTFRIKRLVPYEEIVSETAKANEQIKAENERIAKENEGKPKSKRKKLIKEIPLQRWVGDYKPEDSGISVADVDAMYQQGKKMKLMEPTYDDNGNLIPLSQRFNLNIDDARMREILEDGGTLRVYQKESGGLQNVDEVVVREDNGQWVFNRTIPGRFASRDAALDALADYAFREGMNVKGEPGSNTYVIRRMLPKGQKWRVEGVPGEFDTQFGAVDNARNFLQGHVFEVAEDGNSIEVLGAGSNLDNMLGTDSAAEQRPNGQATAKQRKAEERARKWRERTVANGRRRVEELGQRLGVKVTIVDDMSEQEREGMSKKKRRAKGWYDVRTGEVFINLGNHKTVSDIEATFLHEVVAHKGLRRLFGDEFDKFLHNVYYNVDASIREEINRLMTKNNWDYREATEEYLAKLAQQMNFERPDRYLKAWETVARLFRTLLQKMGLGNGMNLKDSDLQGILFESYHNMEKEGVAGLAESVEFRDWMEREANLPRQSRDTENPAATAAESMFRDDEDDVEDFEDSEDFYEEELEEEAANAEDLGEEVDDSEAGPSTFQEMMLGKMLQAANSAGAAQSARVSAMRSLGGALQQIRKAMSAQRNYDRETVNTIVRLAREVMASGYFNDLTRGEVKRLLAAAKNANGSANVTDQANKVVDTLLRHHLRECENLLKKQLKVKGSKENASGVEVQAGLDIEGQRMTTAMKQGMRLDEQGLSDRVADCLSRMGSSDPVVSSVAAQEYTGLMLAQQYHDTIKASRQEEQQMREEMRQAKEEFAARRDSLSPEELKRQRQDLKDYIAATEDAIRQNRMERADAYNQLSEMLGGGIASSMERAKQWREQQKERVGEIQHNANSDLEGVPADEHMRPTWKHRMANWAVVRFFMKPLATFDYMLRMMGQKSPNGEGYLWNRFMGGWVEANDNEWRNVKAAHKVLDEKVKEVFNRGTATAHPTTGEPLPQYKVKRWSDLFFIERKMKGMDVDFWDGDQIKTHTLTPGNLLYIYMVNKMSDGKMKLRKMGISEEDVEAIKNHLDPRLIELADWLQDEFLVQKRTEYNAVHERMFGAPMAAIENYFPLKINSRSRSQEEDVNNQDANPDDNRGSTITGAIIKRVRNNKALDVTGADAFDVILEHIQNMEHWAAFAEFNRDLNTLLSYKRFRNRMLNMASARFGSGQKLWTNFKRVCAIASGVYRPKVDFDSVDTNLVNVAKGVTRAKIAGRFYTALKQFLSYPAYLSEANPLELIKTTSTPIGWVNSWNWAIDNLPGFAERWQSRQAGDTRLKESDADWGLWKNKVIEIASRLGMTPNALVDAWTFSMGAKAIYETKFKFYKKLGYPEEQAKQRALRDASVSPNETQQSSANAYVSAMQLDRTAASVALTVFRNASMGYQRRLFQSFANLKHMATKGYRAQSLEYLTKQMERDGLDHATAEAAAKKVYNRAMYKNIADVAIFGWVMQFAWNLGAYLPYLFMGDDDDDKKDMLTDAALHAIAGGIEGLTGGSIISDTYNAIRSGDAKATYSNELLPLLSDIESLKRTFKKDVIEGANDLVNLIVQAGVGVNPQTITDWVVAGLDMANGDPELANEFGLLVMRVMSAPQGQLDQLYIDELGMTAGEARKLNAEEFANRYARYKMGRESTFTGWAYSEQGHNDAVDRYVKNFGKKVKERLVGKDIATLDDAYERGDDYMKDIVGKAIKTRLEAADDSELPTIYKYTTNEVTKKTAGREMAKRISKNEDLDEYFDKQRDPVLRKAAASEIAKRLGTQDYAGKTPQAKWAQETKDAHERYQELRTAADVQEDCQVTLLKVSDEDKAELREIKKYLGQGGDDAAIMQEYREARAEILKNYK